MTAPATVLTPFLHGSPAIELGNQLWRKRILPIGDVEYQGRMLHFTRDYLADLAAAFNDGAYDSVPFQLATDSNAHTNDPERTAGRITALALEPDGLYATLQPTERGQRVLSENPGLGVSARIVEQYARSDGRFFPAAIQHVLGTLDPRIPGLGAWRPIDMSSGPSVIIDLSQFSWAGEPAPSLAPDLSDAELADLIGSMSDEELAALESEFYAGDSGYADTYSNFDAAFAQSQAEQAARERARADADLEDLVRPPRTDEDRLERAAARLQDKIYDVPAALSFAQPGREAIGLANDRAMVTGRSACGQVDDFGRCTSRYHALDCGHGTSSADMAAEVAASGAYERALSNFGTGAMLSSVGPAQIPAATIELARQVAALGGLGGSDASWDDLGVSDSDLDDLFTGPARPDVYQAALAELGEADYPDRPAEPGPDVSALSRVLGLK